METPSKAEGWAWGYRRVMSLTLVPSKTEGWGGYSRVVSFTL